MYIHNMEILAHFMPGQVRNGKMQLMSAGNRRYLFQQGDVIDISDIRKPQVHNKGGFQGNQVQVAYNKELKKVDSDDRGANTDHRLNAGSADGQIR